VTAVVGRDRKLAEITSFLELADRKRILLLEGDAGIGKTTLWRAGVDAARELACAGAKSETQLSFTAVLRKLRSEQIPAAFAQRVGNHTGTGPLGLDRALGEDRLRVDAPQCVTARPDPRRQALDRRGRANERRQARQRRPRGDVVNKQEEPMRHRVWPLPRDAANLQALGGGGAIVIHS
jgi:hypothetical protein